MIIIIAFNQEISVSNEYKIIIIIGLFLSLIGDIIFNDKKSRLFSFLLAHIAYIFSIIYAIGFQLNIPSVIPSAILLVILNRTLLPKTGNKKYFVLIYIVIILILLWQAFARVILTPDYGNQFFAIGVILFLISDGLLAYNRFVIKIKFAQFYILSSYYLAQLLIALSI